MVKQGDIIKLNFDPQAGHEQAGYRPAVVISNNFFNIKTNLAIVCPITNTDNKFPLHVSLDQRTKTTGVVLCEHIKALDLSQRNHKVIEKIPQDILKILLILFFQKLRLYNYFLKAIKKFPR